MNARNDFVSLASAVLACDGISAETRGWWLARLNAIKLRGLFGPLG